MAKLKKRAPVEGDTKLLHTDNTNGVIDRHTTHSHEKVPEFMKRAHILSGYRLLSSYAHCAESLFKLHNETCNVWTHFLGGLFFLAATVYVCKGPLSDAPSLDIIMACVFLFSAQLCMFFSAIFHLFGCHSKEVHVGLLRCDLMGIMCLVGGSFIPGLYYGFYCHDTLRTTYLSIFLMLFAAGVVMPHVPCFRGDDKHIYHVMLYAAIVVFGLIPASHWFIIASTYERDIFFSKLLFMFLCYGIGFVFYMTRFPECWKPGLFDIWAHSHTWWHVFVFVATLVWFFNIVDFYQWRRSQNGACETQ